MIEERFKKLIVTESLKRAFEKHNYVFHTDGKINLFGVRNDDYSVGTFNDVLGIHYVKNGENILILHQGTVDPGSYYIHQPMNEKGTWVLRFQQVIDGWAPGLHHGYRAQVQIKPAWGFRITPEQYEADGKVIKLSGKTPILENVACNMHRFNSQYELDQNTNASAGCQVRNVPKEYNDFVELTYIEGAKYNYALFPEKDFL